MEDNHTGTRKLIFELIDIILVIGAIACVVTIDRGRWLINNPAFYQPPIPAEAMEYKPLTFGEKVDSALLDNEPVIAVTGSQCLTNDASLNSDWQHTAWMLNTFHAFHPVVDNNADDNMNKIFVFRDVQRCN